MSFLSKLFGGKNAQPPAQKPAPTTVAATTPSATETLPGSIVSPTGKTPALRIEIDRRCCTAMGDCMRAAPGVFEIDEHGLAIVVDAAAADRERIILAAENCPTQAIRLYELQGQRIYPDWMDSVGVGGGGGAAVG